MIIQVVQNCPKFIIEKSHILRKHFGPGQTRQLVTTVPQKSLKASGQAERLLKVYKDRLSSSSHTNIHSD